MVERSRPFDETSRMSVSLPSAWVFGDVSFRFSQPAPSLFLGVLAQLVADFFREVPSVHSEHILVKRDEPEPVGTHPPSQRSSRGGWVNVSCTFVGTVVPSASQKEDFKEGPQSWDSRKLGHRRRSANPFQHATH